MRACQARIIRLVTAASAPTAHRVRHGQPRGHAHRAARRPRERPARRHRRPQRSITCCAWRGRVDSPRGSIFGCRRGTNRTCSAPAGSQTKVQLVASTERGRFGQHVNIGLTVAGGGRDRGSFAGLGEGRCQVPRTINYSGGQSSSSPHPVWQRDRRPRRPHAARNAGRLELAAKQFEYVRPDDNLFRSAALSEVGRYRLRPVP